MKNKSELKSEGSPRILSHGMLASVDEFSSSVDSKIRT
jgi:hypothetical protein